MKLSKLESAYFALISRESCNSDTHAPDPRVCVLTSILFLVLMLSVPVGHLSMLIWFALYPIIISAVAGIPFGGIFLKSLYVLPLVALIALFNPIYDHTPAFSISGVTITVGWITFTSIIVRGLLAMQCVLILVESSGFTGMCRGMRRLGVPAFLTDQIQFVYRYLSVLLQEAISMRRAREARGYGRKSYPLRLWGMMTGQLFLRAIDRAERINRAMLARGFNGTMPDLSPRGGRLRGGDIIYLIVVSGALVCLRVFDLSGLLFN